MTLEEIRARVVEIENILNAPSSYRNNAILGNPDPNDLVRSETQRRKLIAELSDLRAQLPPTGEASGQHLVLARTLGTVYVRESEPEPLRPDPNRDTDCPLRRAAAEFGWNFDD